MNWIEITLNREQPLCFKGKRIATIKRGNISGRGDSLLLRFDEGTVLELSTAADISEQLEHPRVFLIEGTAIDTFVLLGGEKVYWLTVAGREVKQQSLFRRAGEEEYWTTEIIKDHGIIVIYEAGVFAMDETLNIYWHKSKLLNDKFLGFDGDALKFVRDHDTEWLMVGDPKTPDIDS